MIHAQGFCTTNGRSLDFGLSGYIQSTYCTIFWIFLGFASDSDMLDIIYSFFEFCDASNQSQTWNSWLVLQTSLENTAENEYQVLHATWFSSKHLIQELGYKSQTNAWTSI